MKRNNRKWVILLLAATLIIPINCTTFAVTTPKLIEGFETYASNTELMETYVKNPAGNAYTFSLDSVNKFSGRHGLKFDYDCTPNELNNNIGYCGGEAFMPIISTDILQFEDDWTGGQAIQFWFKGDASNCTLYIQFWTSDGEAWKVGYKITDSTPKIVRLSLRSFKPMWGASVEIMLNHITKFGMFVNKEDGDRNTGTIYLDNFEVVRNADPTPVISAPTSAVSEHSSSIASAVSQSVSSSIASTTSSTTVSQSLSTGGGSENSEETSDPAESSHDESDIDASEIVSDQIVSSDSQLSQISENESESTQSSASSVPNDPDKGRPLTGWIIGILAVLTLGVITFIVVKRKSVR